MTINQDSTPSESPDFSPAHDRARRLLLGAVFLAACASGAIFETPIRTRLAALIPPPPEREILYWVSPHDPSRRYDQPGQDAMGMDLVPVREGMTVEPAPTIDPTIQESDDTTATVERGPLVRTLRTVSTIEYAEPLIGEVTLKVDAWLEKLYVDYEGQTVKQGDRLFDVYSPDLLTTMQNLLTVSRTVRFDRKLSEATVENVRRRLRFWDVSPAEIARIERSETVPETVRFDSPFSGIVIEKTAYEGAFFPAGALLYRIADLSKVWVYVYVYQDEIHCVYEGQEATLTVPGLPGQAFQGKVLFIYPYLEPTNRAVKVRLEYDNPGLALKPDMFAHVDLAPHRMGTGLKIPRQAIINTGRRKIVYIARPNHQFEPRTIATGMSLDGDMVEVLSGLREGEPIVTSSEFLIDSESRLRSFNRKLEPPAPSPKEHQGMPGMSGMKTDAARTKSEGERP